MLHDASRVPSWNSNETWRPRGKVWSDIARTCLWHSMWLGGIGPCGDSNSTVRVVKALCHKLFAQSLCWFHVDSCVIPFRSFCGSWNVVECRFVRGSTSGAANQTGALQHVLVPAWQRRLSAGAGRYLWMRVAWLHTLHTLPCHKGWSDFRKTRKIMKACELWRKHTHRRIHMHGKFLNECHPQNSWQAEFFAASSCFLTLLCFSLLFFVSPYLSHASSQENLCASATGLRPCGGSHRGVCGQDGHVSDTGGGGLFRTNTRCLWRPGSRAVRQQGAHRDDLDPREEGGKGGKGGKTSPQPFAEEYCLGRWTHGSRHHHWIGSVKELGQREGEQGDQRQKKREERSLRSEHFVNPRHQSGTSSNQEAHFQIPRSNRSRSRSKLSIHFFVLRADQSGRSYFRRGDLFRAFREWHRFPDCCCRGRPGFSCAAGSLGLWLWVELPEVPRQSSLPRSSHCLSVLWHRGRLCQRGTVGKFLRRTRQHSHHGLYGPWGHLAFTGRCQMPLA